ncbi:hypothetical protein PINS_up002288 [Pythium insidiosum]|nr:hypothetical protein PINS_up002288 [Pythium insidiosum]
MQIEEHFTNEQLKRIAEFGRVHANLVKEAKEYVFSIETQLKEQFERERESLREQAEAYVGQFQQENEELRAQLAALRSGLKALRPDHHVSSDTTSPSTSENEIRDDSCPEEITSSTTTGQDSSRSN